MKNHGFLLALLLATSGSSAYAQSGPAQGNYQQPSGKQQGSQGPSGGPPQQGQHQGPPPEAIAACQGKASGAPCSFVGRQGENLRGSCFLPPSGAPGQAAGQSAANAPAQAARPMACRPDRGPDRGPTGAPDGRGMKPGGTNGPGPAPSY